MSARDQNLAAPARLFIGVPVYNGERFLAEALDSLLAQTFTDFQLLISDNASTDATPGICAAYCERDSRVRYVRQPHNLGAAGNWNFVANQARSTYFKWASCNDICAPTMLEQCIAALDADPALVLCQGSTALMNEDTGEVQPSMADTPLMERRAGDRLASLMTRMSLNNGQSGVIRLDALRQTRLDRPYPGGDIPLMAELALMGCFQVLPDTLLYRRIGSTTHSELLDPQHNATFYGHEGANTLTDPEFLIHRDIIRAVMAARLPWREKLPILGQAIKALYWNRERRWRRKRAPARLTTSG